MKKKTVIILSVYTFIAGIALAIGLALLITAFSPKVKEAVGVGVSNEGEYFHMTATVYPITDYAIIKCTVKIEYFDIDGALMCTQTRHLNGERDAWNTSKQVLSEMPARIIAKVYNVKVNNTGDIVKGVLLLLLPMGAVVTWTTVIIKRVRAKKTVE